MENANDLIKVFKLVSKILPSCTPKDSYEIATKVIHRVQKGDSDWGVDPKLVILRITASHVRHNYTNYEDIITSIGRLEARSATNKQVDSTINAWRQRTNVASVEVKIKTSTENVVKEEDDWDVYIKNFPGRIIK